MDIAETSAADMPDRSDLAIPTLGPPRLPSPFADLARLNAEDAPEPRFIEDDDFILADDHARSLPASRENAPLLELAGPRRRIFFDPASTQIGIVTCGGLCPGLNDVIRGLVMEAWYRYGVQRIHGFRYGYQGFDPERGLPPLELDPELVSEIHEDGGTILGSSRGHVEPRIIVDCLQRMGVNILFTIGGDGTLRGAMAIADEAHRRKLEIAVIGVPKTIDNDIHYIDQSFGFKTAYSKAVEAIFSAHMEAKGAPNGVGLVKLMGRHSGFIACHATLATSHVNFTLIPESPFRMEGPGGFLEAMRDRLERRRHAVVVVAEGAGQDLLQQQTTPTYDASGNVKLADIGTYLAERSKAYFAELGMPFNLKYIDPSYIIRSVPATPVDSVYCWRLAQNAVHAAMTGRTRMVVGQWHGRLIHLPIAVAVSGRKVVDPGGDLWLSVLESTGQPPVMT